MSKTLQLVFKTENGNQKTISISDPKSDLTLAVVQPIMELLVEKNVFQNTSGKLATVVSANYVEREVTPLA